MFKTAEVLWKLLSGQRLKIFEDCSRKSLYFIDYIAIQNTDDRSGKMAQLVKCFTRGSILRTCGCMYARACISETGGSGPETNAPRPINKAH